MKRLSSILALVSMLVASTLLAGSTSQSPRPRAANLTASSATGFVDISIPASGTVTSGRISWTIEANDGTDYQARTGWTYFAAVNKAGTVTCSVGDVGTTVVAVSAGTLTNTMTCVAGTGKLTLKANAVPSITATTLKIRYFVEIIGASTPSGL